MSKSGMLRSRRRDLNIKPNRRLDRKSSRGMIYENEELRLRTININAEIERGQSDIKKLRRENEQLRKEIWCLRDEYEKLDKLLKEKTQEELDSCSSCTSEITDSCSSCTESEDNETSQNLQNVHKTALNGLRSEFDHLSVVTEETSADNSDKNSNSAVSPPHTNWTAIQPDQSYPTPGVGGKNAMHFFAPLRPSKSADDCFSPGVQHGSSWSLGARQAPLLAVTPPPYENSLQTCAKTTPDVLVQTGCEFPNYAQRSTNSSFTNGGNLDELLQDIQTISNDILTITAQKNDTQKPDSNFKFDQEEDDVEKPFKSELNVVLLPKPMPLLGFDKYQNLLSSRESLDAKKSTEHLGNISPVIPRVSPLPPPLSEACFIQPFPSDLLGFTPTTTPLPNDYHHSELPPQSNPFFFSLPNYENYQNAAIGGAIPPESHAHDNPAFKSDIPTPTTESNESKDISTLRKSHVENESNEGKDASITRQADTMNDKTDNQKDSQKHEKKSEAKDEPQKSPVTRRTRKVSIYFKGKKDKFTRSLSLDTKLTGKFFEHAPTPKPQEKSPLAEKKTNKLSPKFERKISAPLEQKSNSLEQKTPSFDPHKSDQSDKNLQSDGKTSSDSKNSEKKHRKSSSTSPERKHGHKTIEEGQKKCHKRRHRKLSTNRSSLSVDRARERSFSVCTDRSNILDHRFGTFDELTNSERDRSNSISSCDTVKSRKLSNLTNLPPPGKIPWFGCWGNGCL